VTIRFVLASASPARLRTLRSAGLRPHVVISDVDENAIVEELGAAPTSVITQRLAEAKATAVAERLDGAAVVLGCDSMLDVDGQALGKPGSPGEAMKRWDRMRGSTAVLHTGHCLVDVESGRGIVTDAATTVSFADVTDAEIALYAATDEPSHVAGAFTVDGLGGWFVKGVKGDHHNVVGVSLPVVRSMLAELGYSLADVGYPAV
jgi:septum formation protein